MIYNLLTLVLFVTPTFSDFGEITNLHTSALLKIEREHSTGPINVFIADDGKISTSPLTGEVLEIECYGRKVNIKATTQSKSLKILTFHDSTNLLKSICLKATRLHNHFLNSKKDTNGKGQGISCCSHYSPVNSSTCNLGVLTTFKFSDKSELLEIENVHLSMGMKRTLIFKKPLKWKLDLKETEIFCGRAIRIARNNEITKNMFDD
jgi:hypothetical protein